MYGQYSHSAESMLFMIQTVFKKYSRLRAFKTQPCVCIFHIIFTTEHIQMCAGLCLKGQLHQNKKKTLCLYLELH